MPDRNVRVSVKALALNCVTAIVRLHPNVFQLYLDKDPVSPSRRTLCSKFLNVLFNVRLTLSADNNDVLLILGTSSSQPLCDLLLFAKHSDPQLRAICCTLLAALVRSVLVQSGGNWQSWQDKADAKVSACLSLPRLMQFLVQVFTSNIQHQNLLTPLYYFSKTLKGKISISNNFIYSLILFWFVVYSTP